MDGSELDGSPPIPPYPTLEVGIYIGVHTKYRLTPFYIWALKIFQIFLKSLNKVQKRQKIRYN
jgi:hypothetical protein